MPEIPADGQWHRVEIIYRDGQRTVWVDGNRVSDA